MAPTRKPVEPINLLENSFCGNLPAILRMLADRIEANEATADEIEWRVNDKHLRFGATVVFTK